MPSLLDSGQGDPNNPITSLLGSIGSALSGGVAQPSDTQSSMAALLAAAGSMANAGAPTLGPAPTTAQAILGSLGAGRSAAISNEILPFVQRNAMMQQQEQQLEYETKLFNYNRQRAYYDLIKGGAGLPDASATAPAGPPPANVAAPVAPGEPPNYAALPDVQALPDQTRAPVIAMMTQVGMGADEAAQYARMLKAESGGLHIDPKTGQVITNPQSGATGTAQVMPNTFTDMQKKYNIPGSNTDLVSNLSAGGHYFHDQVLSNGGDLRLGTMAYDMGPQGLADWQAGKKPLPAETSDYLVKTGAPPPPTVAASTGPMTPSMNRAIGPNADPLVADPATGEMIPRSQYLAKQPYQVASSGSSVPGPPTTTSAAPPASSAAPGAAADPMVPDVIMRGLMVPKSIEQAAMAEGLASGPEGHARVIQDYVLKKSLMPSYTPTATPGVQVSSQGETSVAPQGTVTISAATPDERKSMFPNVPAWQDILLKRDQAKNIVGYELPEMGPEPMTPISDEQAQKPADQGGAGASYRPQTSYAVGARTGLVKPIQIERGSGVPTGDGSAPPGGSVTPGQISLQGQQFNQAQAAEDQIVHSPVMVSWNQGAQKYDAVLASLNQHNRVGDQAALESLAKVFDPSAVVTEGKISMASNYGGIQQVLQNWLGSITGDAGLPDSVRAQIANLATAEMKTRDAAVMGQIQRSRASAQAKGVNPANVMPLFQTQALTANDPEAKGAPAGVQLAQPYVLQNGQYVRGGQAAPPATTSPATTTPAPATPAPTTTPAQLPVPSATDFQNMNNAGLKAIVADMQVHPDRYSDAYRAALAAEMTRPSRLQRGRGNG